MRRGVNPVRGERGRRVADLKSELEVIASSNLFDE